MLKKGGGLVEREGLPSHPRTLEAAQRRRKGRHKTEVAH